MTIYLVCAILSLLLAPPAARGGAAQENVPASTPLPQLPQILAFDLPQARSPVELAKIRGFIVGYFQGDTREPRWVLDVPRNLTRVKEDGSVRLVLPLADLPAGVYAARIKIRTDGADSDWSPPSPPFALPELVRRRPRPPAAGGLKAPATRPPRTLNLEASLAEAVKSLLPPNMELTDATRGFQKPLQFLSALLASRNLGISFAELKARILEKPGKTRSLGSALADIRPDRDAKAEARKALQQAKRLAGETSRKRRPPATAAAARGKPLRLPTEWLPHDGLLSSMGYTQIFPPGWLKAPAAKESFLNDSLPARFGGGTRLAACSGSQPGKSSGSLRREVGRDLGGSTHI